MRLRVQSANLVSFCNSSPSEFRVPRDTTQHPACLFLKYSTLAYCKGPIVSKSQSTKCSEWTCPLQEHYSPSPIAPRISGLLCISIISVVYILNPTNTYSNYDLPRSFVKSDLYCRTTYHMYLSQVNITESKISCGIEWYNYKQHVSFESNKDVTIKIAGGTENAIMQRKKRQTFAQH